MTETPPNPTPEDRTRIILDSVADGVFTVDREWRITSFNKAAERITGIPKEDAIGRPCRDVFRASICEQMCSLNRTMDTGVQIIDQPIQIENAEGKRIPVSISTALLKDGEGNVIGGVETFRDLSEVEELRNALANNGAMDNIVSNSRQMHQLFDKVDLVAPSDTTVLIEGESGTGKELFARAIHARSHRCNGPMITVNCGALPDTLLESELFGYKAGAFTDARQDKPGRIALAAGGTLFLDEIGDISPMLQIRLLRVLQEKTYEPLGAVATENADVRIVTATNRSLTDQVQTGAFREDLYYRINVVRMTLPPLRERKEDIPLLVDHFIQKYNRATRKQIRGLSPAALSHMMAYAYPGNVRELENMIEYAVLVCRKGWIEPRHLPESLGSHRAETTAYAPAEPQTPLLAEAERMAILEALTRHQWNRSAAARHLGIHTTTLWRKIKRLGITPPEPKKRNK